MDSTSPTAAGLAPPPSTHLVSVHTQIDVAIGCNSDSDEEAVALRSDPPALELAAFVGHAAGETSAAAAGSGSLCFEGRGGAGMQGQAGGEDDTHTSGGSEWCALKGGKHNGKMVIKFQAS